VAVQNRIDLLKQLAEVSIRGNLGLFIGAGFSKAVTSDIFKPTIALSWGELIKNVSTKFQIKYEECISTGLSYPEIASKICRQYSKLVNIPYATATMKFKEEIAASTCWYPDSEQRNIYSPLMQKIDPQWIITTNYDLIIECLLPGKCQSLSPFDKFSVAKGLIPVYHLHGVRSNPSSIIITNEDYIALFRPNEYRQIKLSTMFSEATTLLLGYGLGDVNVLTALDWASNVYQFTNQPSKVIQLLYRDKPQQDPYTVDNGITILEISDIQIILHDLCAAIESLNQKIAESDAKITGFLTRLANNEDKIINAFQNDTSFRMHFLKAMDVNYNKLVSMTTYIEKALDATYREALKPKMFSKYADYLNMILDMLVAFEFRELPPVLCELIVSAFDRVAGMVKNELGGSYAAADLWINRRAEISKDNIEILTNHAEKNNMYNLFSLLKSK
jgi:hypothetical protein